MARCPYCGTLIQLKDFFKKEEGFLSDDNNFIQESIEISGYGEARMWICPKCDKILGFSEHSYSSHH